MKPSYDCIATGIGSLPHVDPDAAVALALRSVPEAPFWPQLPKRGFRESMGCQYAASWPGVVIDEVRERVFIDTARDLAPELERFYERYLATDLDHFALAERDAAGFHALLRALAAAPPAGARFLKGQVTGPLTAGTLCKDAAGRDIIHDEALFDAVVKGLAMNAAWQVRTLGAFGKPVIVFVDEPAMESLGSAFAPAAPELVAAGIDEIADAIHGAGGLAGIHCCGNADWPLVFGTRVDIVNFDAYGYADRVLLQPEAAGAFLQRGGALAWGIVPTLGFTGAEKAEDLVERLEAGIARLAAAGIPRETVLRQAVITPSCGMGSLAPEAAEAILRLNLEVARRMQGKLR